LFEIEGKRTYVFVDGVPAAVFVLRERAREGVHELWEQLREQGIRATVLTGDPAPQFELPESVALRVGLSASEKAAYIIKAEQEGETPIFVGDGVNDASAMACASGSIAMGTGAGLTRSAATGQLSSDQIGIMADAVALSLAINRRLRGNLIYAASYNAIGMVLAALGWLHPVAAAGIMLVSSLTVTARALGFRR
ncbi:MAG: HAD-IC family P-type ATPase, partial [Lentimonas sp.]